MIVLSSYLYLSSFPSFECFDEIRGKPLKEPNNIKATGAFFYISVDIFNKTSKAGGSTCYKSLWNFEVFEFKLSSW